MVVSLLLVLACFRLSLAVRAEPKWEDYSTVIPALEKKGHSWMIPIDNENNAKAFAGIAVAVHNNEILFAEYKTDHGGSAFFYSPRGGTKITKSQFFLLQEDFMALQRRYLQDLPQYLDSNGAAKAHKEGSDAECTPVMFEVDNQKFMPILDKPGRRSDMKVTKFIGTYWIDADKMAYQDDSKRGNDAHVLIHNVRAQFLKDKDRADRTEFLCRSRHTY